MIGADLIQARKSIIGNNVVIENTAIIRGVNGPAEEVFIGDNTYIGHHVQIICDHFSIGDYGKIHHHTNIHGYNPCIIGHNAWIGQHSLIDSIGTATIGDNCGIGAYSQLWSHVKFGDTLAGCRFLNEKPLVLGNDVWLVGHCIVSPITAADKSMALAGAVVTKDMVYNTIYAGCPAVSVSNKLGPQFEEVALDVKFKKMQQYISQANVDERLFCLVATPDEFKKDGRTYFALLTRQYLKQQSNDEIILMKYLLPHRAKFVPFNSSSLGINQ